MSRSMIQWCFLAVLVLVGVVAITSGSASGSGSNASPGSEPVVSVASASLAELGGDALASSSEPLAIPAELTAADQAEPMACDPTSCIISCRSRGWCEGECVGGSCRCFIRPNPNGICP